uniref:Nucleocapsid protein n=1 Tax=Lepidopteran phasma-related virus OKIAV246 TaxID=2746306 RepID=A0A7D7FM40_9VIRU|nr:nucleocapsid protein [Lepidopteran phasma-related virus OKIAV246]
MTENILPTNVVSINLDVGFASNFLSAAGTEGSNKASVVLAEILEKVESKQKPILVSKAKTTNGWNFDTDCDFIKDQSATVDGAYLSYMLASYYTLIKKEKKVGKINIIVNRNDPIVFDFYNLTGINNITTTGGMTTDNDVIHAAILWQNMLVKNMRKNGYAAMHPLSRVAASENSIAAFVDFMEDSGWRYTGKLPANTDTAVKLFNTACSRKPHQFTGQTAFYVPELAAATLVTSVMTSAKPSPGLISITNKTLGKISRAAGGFDTDLVSTLMEFTTGGSGSSTAEEIFNAFKNKKQAQMIYVRQPGLTVQKGYRTMADDAVEAYAPSNVGKDFQIKGAGNKKK